ncbi:MAG: hypothetical protein AMJ81_10235 [Phycisphaerae bacterium SM23_33]|nr:MAG: hypothetical protein AMJ81_10235 [Phycisphaerae bacterium SM23_33]
MTLPASKSRELVTRLLDGGSWQVRPFGAGKFSETFDVSDGGRRYVLRVAPPDDLLQLFYERRMMRQEPAIHARLLAETSLPVAAIVAYDFSRCLLDRDYLIMPRLEGAPLSQAGLSGPQHARALREWGGYIAQVHSLTDPENRFGYLGQHQCMEPRRTWAEAFAVMYRKELDDVVACGVYDRATADAAQRLLEKNLAAFEHCTTSRLLHGDIWATNLLVAEDGRVTGVLDFDRACWGDPEWDLAIADYCGVTRPPFLEGYGGRIDRSPPEAALRRMFYLLYEHQKYIVISMSSRRGRNEAMTRAYARESLGVMENFRRTGLPGF